MLHATKPHPVRMSGLVEAVDNALSTLPRGAHGVSVRMNDVGLCGLEGLVVIVRGKAIPVYFEPIATEHPLTFRLTYGLGNLE